MKKMAIVLSLLAATNSQAWDLVCTDGVATVKVQYDYENSAQELPWIDNDIFNHNHIVEISYDGETIKYTDLLAVATDGFGNDYFQAFVHGDYSSVIEEVFSFSYEHEGAYLSGGFDILYGANEGQYYGFESETMKCSF